MSTAELKTQVTGKPSGDNPIAAFSGFLDKFKPQMALCLPKHLTPDRMARLAVTAFSTTPKLQRCEPKSIVASIMTASTLGLEINVNGQGYLVPYGTTCQFVPGWKGLVDLMNRSGKGTVFTGVIFKDQRYTFTDGARRDLVIHNETDLDDAKDITHAYAIGWVKGSDMPIIELWRVSKLEKHRDRYNKVGKQHYSYRDWEMYARKIPLLQVLKYMPQSIELQNAIQINDAAENGQNAVIDGEFVNITDPTDEARKEAMDKVDERSTNDKMRAAILACDDLDLLDLTADQIREIEPASLQAELNELVRQRRAELEK
jgi:recombination protein RecT